MTNKVQHRVDRFLSQRPTGNIGLNIFIYPTDTAHAGPNASLISTISSVLFLLSAGHIALTTGPSIVSVSSLHLLEPLWFQRGNTVRWTCHAWRGTELALVCEARWATWFCNHSFDLTLLQHPPAKTVYQLCMVQINVSFATLVKQTRCFSRTSFPTIYLPRRYVQYHFLLGLFTNCLNLGSRLRTPFGNSPKLQKFSSCPISTRVWQMFTRSRRWDQVQRPHGTDESSGRLAETEQGKGERAEGAGVGKEEGKPWGWIGDLESSRLSVGYHIATRCCWELDR